MSKAGSMWVEVIPLGVIESADSSCSTESHDISWLWEVPVLMSPPLSSDSHSCSGFVHNESDSVLGCNFSQLLVEVRSCHGIIQVGDWFDNYSTHVWACRFWGSDLIPHSVETSVFFSFVLVFELWHGVLCLWEGRELPVVGLGIVYIQVWVTAGQGHGRGTVGTILESNHREFGSISQVVILSVFNHSSGDCLLISLSDWSIAEMHSSCRGWSNWHDMLSDKLGKVFGW